jgi:hypothetical protein
VVRVNAENPNVIRNRPRILHEQSQCLGIPAMQDGAVRARFQRYFDKHVSHLSLRLLSRSILRFVEEIVKLRERFPAPSHEILEAVAEFLPVLRRVLASVVPANARAPA